MTPPRSTTQKNILVHIIEPHQILLWGIKHLINSDSRFDVCATSTNGTDALRDAEFVKPHVILIEPELEGEDAIALIDALIQKTGAKVALLTSNQDPSLQDRAILKGAKGVVLKNESPETLLKALQKISEGELWLNQNATSRILKKVTEPNATKNLTNEQLQLAQLTPKELLVTKAIQLHHKRTLKQVADSLHISEHTLRNHLASIYDKLEVRNRLELYVFCGKYQKTDDPNNHPKRRATDD
jgi:two-component system nitrate/nitrite response regulator NarL